MTGKIHSIESFGTVDGPGVRFVVFMQGCPLRCLYCHNPDTWNTDGGIEMTTDEVIEKYRHNSAFYSKGGITVTGGEPLLQIDFLIELFEKAKKEKVHTCIDTSGITFNPKNTQYMQKLDRLMQITDLVLLDIKQVDTVKHKALTGFGNENILEFAKYLESRDIPLWIRHIVIEGITNDPDELFKLGKLIGELSNLRALDVLAYHTMGVSKYKELGIDYPLKDTAPTTKEATIAAKNIILDGIREVKQNGNQAK